MNRTTREVLQLLRLHGRISRTELARELGLTRMAISATVESLLKSGIIEPVGTSVATSRGRPAETFQITGKRLYCLGVDVDFFSVTMVILDWYNNVVASTQVENRFRTTFGDSGSATTEVLDALRRMMDDAGIRSINGGGLAHSTDVHDEAGLRILATNDFASVEQANDFFERLKVQCNAPIWLERNVDAALLAERWSSTTLPRQPNLFYVTDRLGFAMMLDGRPWRGPTSGPRWLGRMQVDPNGPVGPGFLPGAMESTSMITIIDRLDGFAFASRPRTSPQASHERFKQILDLYEKGHPAITLQIHEQFQNLGLILRNLISLFSFDAIYLHGWSPRIVADGIEIIQKCIAKLPGPPGWPHTVVRANSLGYAQQAIGAAIASIDHLLASRQVSLRAVAKRRKTGR